MINIAIIGVGYWGQNLVRNFNKIKGSKVHSVCDVNEEKLRFIKKRYPDIKLFKDFNKILKNPEIDATVIALPAKLHYEFGKKTLLAKKHVLIEKPLTTKVCQAKELIKLGQKNRKILMVGHTFLYNDAVRKIKEYIDKNKLGKIYSIYFQRLNLGRIRQDVNAMLNFAPHDISIALFWLGEKPIRVLAKGKDYIQKGIEDLAFLDMEFKNKKFVQIYSSWLNPEKVRKAVILGSEKMLVYNDVSETEKIKVFDKKIDQKFNVCAGKVFIPKIKFREPLFVECSHFIDCIKKNKTPLTDGENGLRVVEILEAGQESLKKHQF